MIPLKVLALCLPSLAVVAIISYRYWKGKRRQPLEVPPDTPNSSNQNKTSNDDKTLNSPSSSPQSKSSAAVPLVSSPSDSGFTDQSTPLRLQTTRDNETDSTPQSASLPSYHPPPSPPLPPSSAEKGRHSVDTTAIRGGRVRATLQLPVDVIGRFIGRQGRNIKTLMSESGAQIHVQQKSLTKDSLFVPCIVQGTQSQINSAIDLILTRHPEVSFSLPPVLPPSLPPVNTVGKVNDIQQNEPSWDYTIEPSQCPSDVFLGIVTYIERLNRLWLVPYTSTQLLETLHQSMSRSYTVEETGAAKTTPIIGKHCAVRVSDDYWLRGRVAKAIDEKSFEIQLTDYGSSVIVPGTSMKPLKREHTLLKVQAFSCLLSNIEPNTSNADDGMLVLQALVEGTVLEVHVIVNVAKTDPLVELYIPSHYGSGGQAFINRELVNQGFATWCESTTRILPIKEATPANATPAFNATPTNNNNNERSEEEMPIGGRDVEGVASLPLLELLKKNDEETELILNKNDDSNQSLVSLLSAGTSPLLGTDLTTPSSLKVTPTL